MAVRGGGGGGAIKGSGKCASWGDARVWGLWTPIVYVGVSPAARGGGGGASVFDGRAPGSRPPAHNCAAAPTPVPGGWGPQWSGCSVRTGLWPRVLSPRVKY